MAWRLSAKAERTKGAHAKEMESQTTSLSIVALSASFISERRYLQNVSPKTLEWYKNWFRAFEPYLSTVSDQSGLRSAGREARHGDVRSW